MRMQEVLVSAESSDGFLTWLLFYELNSGQPVVAPPEAIRQGIFLRGDNTLPDFCNSASN